jgi:hypothetical protein
MKKLFFIYLLVVFTAFGTIVDNLDIFGVDNEILLSGRITQLKEMYQVDFLLYTNKHKDYSIKNILKQRNKTVVIAITKDEDNIINVQISASSDIDLNSYGEDINKILDNLSILMEKEEYGDYTLELLANIGEIINLINIEKSEHSNKENLKISHIFSLMFKILLISVFIFFIYYIYKFYLLRKNLTTCSFCGKNMLIDEEIEKDGKIMKIYKCSSCGKIKRTHIKKS